VLDLRIVFFGTPELSVEALRVLVGNDRHEVVLCVTQPDRPAGRNLQMRSPAVKRFCDDRGIPCTQPDGFRKKSDRLAIESFQPDLLMTASYGRMIPTRIFSIGRWNAINLHPSLLPKFRGAAPVRWTILSGEAMTGVSIISMTRELDAGDILLQRRFEIPPRSTWGELSADLFHLGGDMLLETADLLESGEAHPIPQNHEEASYASKIGSEDRALSFRATAEENTNRIRAMLPRPQAFFTLKGERVNVTEVPFLSDKKGAPGEILDVSRDGITVACSKGSLLLTGLKAEGRREMSAVEFANGRRLQTGEMFNDG
jgi:methionyl-tRNA formyltransferase